MNQTLLLLPGMLNDVRAFAPVMPMLSGWGTLCVPVMHAESSLEDMARRALDAVGNDGPLAVAGFSLGGYVAQEVLTKVPHRVVRLALLGTGCGAMSEKARPAFEALRTRALSDFASVVADLPGLSLHPSRLADRDLVSALQAMFRDIGGEAHARQITASMARKDRRPQLAAFQGPALVVSGKDDRVLAPGMPEKLAAALPHARIESLHDCGHMLMNERSEEVGALLTDWLKAIV